MFLSGEINFVLFGLNDLFVKKENNCFKIDELSIKSTEWKIYIKWMNECLHCS